MADPDRVKLRKTIRKLRLASGWTQERLADAAGLHPTYIGGIERGERNVSFDNLLKIARALREHPSILFSITVTVHKLLHVTAPTTSHAPACAAHLVVTSHSRRRLALRGI